MIISEIIINLCLTYVYASYSLIGIVAVEKYGFKLYLSEELKKKNKKKNKKIVNETIEINETSEISSFIKPSSSFVVPVVIFLWIVHFFVYLFMMELGRFFIPIP